MLKGISFKQNLLPGLDKDKNIDVRIIFHNLQ